MLDLLMASHRTKLSNKLYIPGLNGDLYKGTSVLNQRRPDHMIAMFKCGSLMNASGLPITKAWDWAKGQFGESAKLVILHDELDLSVGKIEARNDRKARYAKP